MLNKNSPKPKVSKLFLPYDVYERHKKVGSLIKTDQSVLDVGGQLDYLSQFSQPAKVIVANLESATEVSDVIIDKEKLPFKDNSFSTVTAIDVLEHIPKNTRPRFIQELLRVAQKTIILSFPIGTPKHIAYEKHLASQLRERQEDINYLAHHVKYGLPKKGEIEKLIEGLNSNLSYSGNLFITNLLFKIHLFDPKIIFIRQLVYWAKLFFNLVSNPILYLLLSNKIFSHNVVRAYLVITK